MRAMQRTSRLRESWGLLFPHHPPHAVYETCVLHLPYLHAIQTGACPSAHLSTYPTSYRTHTVVPPPPPSLSLSLSACISLSRSLALSLYLSSSAKSRAHILWIWISASGDLVLQTSTLQPHDLVLGHPHAHPPAPLPPGGDGGIDATVPFTFQAPLELPSHASRRRTVDALKHSLDAKTQSFMASRPPGGGRYRNHPRVRTWSPPQVDTHTHTHTPQAILSAPAESNLGPSWI